MDEGADDKKGGKKVKKAAGGTKSNVNGNTGNGAKESKTTKNGNFEVPQTSSK